LDRYGLSLSELDLQRQACEGGAVGTAGKRAGPVDDCVPATIDMGLRRPIAVSGEIRAHW
jgi:hypothetical protein